MVKMVSDFSISENSQKELLLLARKAIEGYLKNSEVIDFPIDDNNELLQIATVFVTLTQNGNLRGCIGTIAPQYSLYKAVIRMSLSAALNDSRFFPLTLEELPKTKIEISVLSPMHKIKSAKEITKNKHGVLIQKGNRSGLFLPQVWEHFNDKEDFMNNLCLQKAGIAQNSWKDSSAEIFVFTVFSFEENENFI
ncbi:MAG: AmmeMemoRadiSam system protein A [Endomicrobium sp.]|jgi:AmmeMemoRadiSam system protein A|nr:AmmeMemoRadiSam system protein A [Endomicrobium sp.]